MRLIQPTKALTYLLVTLLSIPQPLLAQRRVPIQPKKTTRSDQIAAAIDDLLKERPINPEADAEEKLFEDEDLEANKKPPADDAPIGELIAYWSARSYQQFDPHSPKPSDKVRERILEAYENRPWLGPRVMELLPTTPDALERVYRLAMEEQAEQSNFRGVAKNWLMRNSSYFREELLNDIRNQSKTGNYMDRMLLQSLINQDWEAAKPFVEAMLVNPQPHMMADGLALLHNQAVKNGNSAEVESLRTQLQAIVSNQGAGTMARQSALDSLMQSEWPGREEWYLSLFADTSLSGVQLEEKKADDKTKSNDRPIVGRRAPSILADREGGENFLWGPLMQSPDKLVAPVLGLIGSGNRAIHLAAVGSLLGFLGSQAGTEEQRKQVARAMLPWLSQPDWGGSSERWSYLQAISNMDLPESVPGLIWVLDNDELIETRASAAEALVRYKNPLAVPALRRSLNRQTKAEFEQVSREVIIRTLIKLGGVSDAEALAGIEAYSRRLLTDQGRQEIDDIRQGDSDKILPLNLSIGAVYSEGEDIEISDSLATLLFNRAKELRKTQPDLAAMILEVAYQSNGVVADLQLAEFLIEGWVDVEAVKMALDDPALLRKHAADKLEEMFKRGGYQTGLAAVLMGEEDKRTSVLNGKDTNAQLALLAAARYRQEKLPVETVGKLMNSSAALSAAAESYLEVEDSAEARKLVWARHPGEARILGETFFFRDSGRGSPATNKWEDSMREEVRRADGATPEKTDVVYAVANVNNPNINNSIIIRVRKGQAELSLYQVEGRRQVRMLNSDELQELKDFTSREEVENLKAESGFGRPQYGPPLQFEFLRLTKDGGRRIMLSQPHRAPKKDATLHEQLGGLFYRLSKTGDFRLRYSLEDKIPGVDVLLADDKRPVIAVCQDAGQLRALVGVERVANQPIVPEKAFEWRSVEINGLTGELGAPVDEPKNCQVGNVPGRNTSSQSWMREQQILNGVMFNRSAKVGEIWYGYAMVENESGLWKFEEDKPPVKILDGIFASMVATPDGKWIIAQKTIQTDDNYENKLVRINLVTKRESPITVPQATTLIPVTFVAAHNKVLLAQQQYQYNPNGGGTNYLLDAETGVMQPTKGEFRPLMNQFGRTLQPTGKPNEFWAAIYDNQKKATVFGRYDERSFTLTPAVELPEIRVNSADTFADAATKKLYFVYLGHLLRVPMTK